MPICDLKGKKALDPRTKETYSASTHGHVHRCIHGFLIFMKSKKKTSNAEKIHAEHTAALKVVRFE